ncbi:MAG: HAMP domain-containing protein [Burkholderiaceae bacterium]|nr:HAMP domain-containing protein [Burkholderiaceae bacterium]
MRISLFWRTFLLIAGLVVACLMAMLELIRIFDPAPAEQKLAWEVASVVNLTRSALVSAQSDRRVQLLAELAREEGVRVAPLEPGDRSEPLEPAARAQALLGRLRGLLGPQTRVAASVNGEHGLWVSFEIDGDPYWLGLSARRFERQLGPPWWALLGLAATLGLLGALAVAAPLNKPLARLSQALGRVSRGDPAPPLPETGPTEIAALNRRFNRMVSDLTELESDRAVALAGISHDIRTPLTRLRMEIELSPMAEADKESMSEDITRIDAIVGKFMEYARTAAGDRQPGRIQSVVVADVIETLRTAYQGRLESGDLTLAVSADPQLRWRGDPLDLTRMLSNLIENALRYGRSPDSDRTELSISAARQAEACELIVSDRGPGVPQAERQRLLRPFSRLDSARSELGGSGLGLAIVARLAQRYGGQCVLEDNPEGSGLLVRIRLPDAASA